MTIGIDLGTTNSCLAYFNPETNNIDIIPNSLGDRITPSLITLTENQEIMVGQMVLDQDQLIISHVKRFIGQKYGNITDIIENLEYQVISDHNDFPLIPIQDKKLKPEEVSAQVLRYLKECAEEYLGQKVTSAVITVPAYFNEAQRRATKDACTIAGLDCLRLVAEPTAACLCYGLHKNQEETVLVFDLGGGTLDCSILNLFGGIFEVVATSGNTQLGGTDIDIELMNFLNSQYQEDTGNSNQTPFNQMMAEDIKKRISNLKQYTVRLPDGYKYILTRTKFEEIIMEFVEACMEPVDQVLQDAEMSYDDISQIVLVGGSTRVPLIQETLSKLFNGRPLNKSINPDEAVAYGAAVQASILKQVGSRSKEMILLDVNPLSLGLETSGGIMNVLIKRNSTLPCEAKKVFSTVDDNQETVEIKVFQGERQFTRDNIKLGDFLLSGLPRAARGVPKIVVTFKLNCDGLLEVSAVDKNTGLTNQITLSSESNLDDQEIQKLLKEADKFKAQDYNQKQSMDEMNKFEKYIYELQRNVNLPEMKDLLDAELSQINQYLINSMDWIVANRGQADVETIQNARSSVEFNMKPTLNKMYSHQESLQKSGITSQNTDIDQSGNAEAINDLIEDMCQNLK